MGNKNIILGLSLVIAFAFLVTGISFYFSYQHSLKEQTKLTPEMIDVMTKEEIKEFIEERRDSPSSLFPLYYLLPLMSFAGIIVGASVYYIMEEKIERKKKQLKNNTQIILKLLSPGERKVVELLLEKNGKAMQFELTRIPGFNKVRTHRVLKEMELKGVIEKEKLGKVRIVKLNPDIYEVLKTS